MRILTENERVRVFACPACGETIALGCKCCRFCSAVIEPGAAAAAADLMDRVNLACSEAEKIRAVVSREDLDPDWLGNIRSRPGVYLLPFLLISWWVRFGLLRTKDEEFLRARHHMKLYAITGAALVVAMLLVLVLSVWR